MVIALSEKWIWDSWYVRDGDLWHGFFLQADKAHGDPDHRHVKASQGHATSRDLKTWEHRGTCFVPSASPAFRPLIRQRMARLQDQDAEHQHVIIRRSAALGPIRPGYGALKL